MLPSSARSLVILVAPLNWGLGHATRCIPLIHTLQQLGCEVITASDGASRTLLVEEFPLLTHLSSPHTPIRYSRYKWLFGWAMLRLIPRFWIQLKREQRWIKKTVRRYHINAIISDNRYGLAHPNVPAVIITHQLGIRTGYGRLADRLARQLLYRYINRYQAVWVPDVGKEPSLAGALSHPLQVPAIPLHYIGMLNRLSMAQPQPAPADGPVLVLLSGPEPQRTILEKIILEQAASYTEQLIVVRGLPTSASNNTANNDANEEPPPTPPNSLALLYGVSRVKLFDHLSAADLQALLPTVSYIICRSGYTTLMEMIPLQKKLLLIPTPGQPEQTYLAAHADHLQYAPQFSQHTFSIVQALQTARQYPYLLPTHFSESTRHTTVTRWIEALKSNRPDSA
jgi:UDP:flavonoid glycosyltransferase YjiC (YdhE family)